MCAFKQHNSQSKVSLEGSIKEGTCTPCHQDFTPVPIPCTNSIFSWKRVNLICLRPAFPLGLE